MSEHGRAVAISLGIAACCFGTVSPTRATAVVQINDQSKMEIGITRLLVLARR